MIKGINQNFSPEGTPAGFAFYSKNIIVNQKLDEIVNEKGNEILTLFNDNNITGIVGIITFGNYIIVFYKANGNDTIGVIDEELKTYSVRVSRTDLQFSEEYPITGEAKLNSNNELIVTFTDGVVSTKYVNLTTADPSDSLSIYNLSPLSNDPIIDPEVVENSGTLKAGVYYALLSYKDKNKTTSNWSALSVPIYIVAHKKDGVFYETVGTDSGVATDKGIKLNLTGIDTSYTSILVALISKINDVIEVRQYKEMSISGTSMSVTITGTEISTVIDITEVLTTNQNYETAKHIASLNDQLFLADVTTTPITDFQPLVNKIQIKWTSKPVYDAVKTNSALFNKAGNKAKTLMHDEVYAFYAKIELPNGRYSEWFHIPGRALTGDDINYASNSNSIKIEGEAPRAFQLNETCTFDGISGSLASSSGYAYGTMGGWENKDEIYPSNFPDFAGQSVRHHRFPSIRYLMNNVYTNTNIGAESPKFASSIWSRLGIMFQLTDIPTALQGKFRSIHIGYAKRDEANVTVIGYDVVQLGAHPQIPGGGGTFDLTTITGAGGNWYIESPPSNNDIRANNTYVRLHSPDLLMNKPSVSNIYTHNIKRMNLMLGIDYSTSLGYGALVQGREGGNVEDVYVYISDYTKSIITDVITAPLEYLALENPVYVPNNTNLTRPGNTINNLLSEETLVARLENSLGISVSGVDLGTGRFKVAPGGTVTSPGLFDATVLTTIKVMRTNLFNSYIDQVVVPLDNAVYSPVVGTFYHLDKGDGDGFICLYSFLTMASMPKDEGQPFNYTGADGIRCVKMLLLESRYNLNERYSDIANLNTYFYPYNQYGVLNDKGNYWYIKLDQLNCPVNTVLYSKDFNAVNDLELYGVYNHKATYQTKLPYAIARGQKAIRDNDLDDGWRKFKPNDIFFTTKDKGPITNLKAWGTDQLLIHHKYALLKTRDKAVLQSDIAQISLGSGDLFELEPREISPTDYGYGGCQHKFSTILCEIGYVFTDAEVGEVMLHSGGNDFEVITKGFKNFFRDTFRDNPVNNNPFSDTGSCITIGFDKKNYRLILSLRAQPISGVDNSFTMSFDLIQKEWSSAHDYKPKFLFNTRKTLYSIKDDLIYEHGIGKVGTYYGITYPSFVDLLVNVNPREEKILNTVSWITRVEKLGVNQQDETITHITIRNDYFTTGKIAINPRVLLSEYEDKNTSQRDRTWTFNQIFDIIKNLTNKFTGGINEDYNILVSNIDNELAWFEKEPLRGKYFIIRLEYSNIEDKLVSLRDFNADIELSN